MKNHLYISFLAALVMVLSCGQNQQEESSFSEQAKSTASENVQVGYLKVEPLLEEIYCTGTVDVPPMERKVIHSYIEANINSIRVIQGEQVKKGQLLATLSHPNLISLQQELLASDAEINFQQGELDRKKQLLASNATSIREINDIQRKLQLAKVNFNAKKEHLSLLGIDHQDVIDKGIIKTIEIRAPFDGKLSKVFPTNGAFVANQDPLFEVLNEDHKHLELDVFAKHADKVKIGQKIHFRIPGNEKVFSGKVYLINPDIGNNKLRVHGHLDDESLNIKIGTFIEATIFVNSASVAQIAVEELIQEGEQYFLFRPSSDGFEKIQVSIGRSNEQLAELINIDTDRQWVVKGNYYLQ